MRAVLYARVSSERQAEKDLSIPAQLKALRQYAEKRGWDIVEQFVDEAESARTANRPNFQKMIGLARQKPRPFDTILVWKLSRFARNRDDSVLYKALLRRHGVQVISSNEHIDDSPAGRMFEGMIEVVDEFYSANLAHDTVRGMNENASRGFLNGGRAPYGYRRVKVKVGEAEKAKLEADPEHAPLVKRIFEMCLNGMGVKEIARKLNAEGYRTRDGNGWANTVLYYMLTNETYTGATIFNGYRYWDSKGGKEQKPIRVEGTHAALVSPEQFARVQALLKQRSPRMTHPRVVSSEYLLSGLAYCGSCGAKLIGTTAKGGKFFYYGCQTYLKKGKEACNSGLMSRNRLEEAVITQLKRRVLTEENLTDLVKMVNEEMSQLMGGSAERLVEIEAQLRDLKARLQKLYAAIETGSVDLVDLGPRIKELREQIQAVETKKREIESQDAKPIEVGEAEVKKYVDDLQALLMRGSIMERKTFLRGWIKKVELNKPEGGTIEYALPLVPTKKSSRLDGGYSSLEVLSTGKIGCGTRIRT